MKFAISSQNWLTITSHPGKTGRFRIFEAEAGVPPRELDRLELPAELTLHNVHGDDPHPLYDVDVVISGSAGTNFIERLERHGVRVATTSEKDPLAAIKGFLDGTLLSAAPHDH
ncbi:MAG: NifB/NifX family molybdenum-iron cluster-binding protein [Bacteroidota bacterium]